MIGSKRLETLRGRSIFFVVAVIGVAAIWRSASELRIVLTWHEDLGSPDATPWIALVGPGLFGLALMLSLVLIAASRRMGEVVYWAAVVLGSLVLLLFRFGSLGLLTLPDGRGWLHFVNPGQMDGSLDNLLEAAMLGALSILGLWIVKPAHDGADVKSLPVDLTAPSAG